MEYTQTDDSSNDSHVVYIRDLPLKTKCESGVLLEL